MQWSLFRNLPTTADGDVDFAVFENGPPLYISQFLRELEAGHAWHHVTHHIGWCFVRHACVRTCIQGDGNMLYEF